MQYFLSRYKCLFICVFLIFSDEALSQESDIHSNNSPKALQNFHLFSDSQEIDEFIYREPNLAYQQILNIASDFSGMSDNNQIWWLLRKAQAENLLYLYENFEETVIQVKDLLVRDSNPKILCQTYLFMGKIKERKGEYSAAEAYFEQVISIAKANKLTQQYITAKQALAYTYGLSELFEMSMVDLQEAHKEAFILNDTYLIATINETYGLIYDYLGEYQKSIDYYQKALDTYSLKGYQAKAADSISGLASTYRSWGKYDKALEYFTWYQDKIVYSPNSKHLKFFAAYGLGMTLAEKGDCKEAIEVIDSALNYEGLNDYNAELYKRKASCYIKLNQLEKADAALVKAENIYLQYPELVGTRWQLELIKVRGELNYAARNYQVSFDLLHDYYRRYVALIKTHSSERIIKVRTNLELERKNIENDLNINRLQLDKLQKEKIAQQASEKLYLLFFIVIIVIVMLTVFVIQYRNHQKVLSLSSLDSLSNLYNRRYIFDYLDKLFSSSTPKKSELTIVLIDIDNFKYINDNFGHPFGDQVIRTIAQIGVDTLRTEDVMGRVGGEEFLCVLPRIDSNQSLVVAQRLLDNIAKYKFITPSGEPFSTTVSIGIARLSEHVIDSDMLYAQADQALYQSKRAGKNRVTVFKQKKRD